jgi:hypothetical protein
MSKVQAVSRFLTIVFGVVLLTAQWSPAATHMCGTNGVNNSCTPSGMQSLISAASSGDTINIANGTHAWSAVSAGVLINKSVTINGGGRYAVDANYNDTGTWPVRLNTGTATAFIINVPTGTGMPRITGINFDGNPRFNYGWWDSDLGLFINVYGANRAFYRIDNNKFHSTGSNVGIWLNSKGLMDHNYLKCEQLEGFGTEVQSWGASGTGDEAWAEPIGYGTANFMFIEDNTFIRPRGQVVFANPVVDAYVGGKYVFRHNYVRNAMILNHDKSGGNWTRAGVAFEVYNNIFEFDDSITYQTPFYLRDGTALYYHNEHRGFYQSYIKFWNRRTEEAQGNWGLCNGTKSWDGNIGPQGYPCADQVGRGPAAGLGPNNVQPQPRVPVRIWGNTGPATGGCDGTAQQGGKVCNGNPTTIIAGTDYIFSNDNSAALPGYSPYPYPHPMQGGATAALSAPTNLRVVP